MVAFLFWAGVSALIFDWRYIRAGGERPSTDDYRYLAYAVGLCVLGVVGFGAMGARAEGLGDMTALLTATIVAMWGWRRYRIRKAHPVLKQS